MRRLGALIVVPLTLLAGCSGGGEPAAEPSSSQSTSLAAESAPLAGSKGCALLDPAVVQRVTGLEGLSTVYLGPSGEPGRRCAYVLTLRSGDGVVSVTELSGGAARYHAVRRAKVDELGSDAVRDLTGLGNDAFAAGTRYLAVRVGARVYTLEGLFGVGGQALPVKALRALAEEMLRRE